MADLYEVILQRKAAAPEDSYVAALLSGGLPGIHGKIAEEAGELIEASRCADRGGIIHETADLWFHMLVLLAKWGIGPEEIYSELARRRGVSGLTEKRQRGRGGAG